MKRLETVSVPKPDMGSVTKWSVTIPVENIKYFDKDGNECTAKEAFEYLTKQQKYPGPNFTVDTNGPVHIEELRRQIAIYDELMAEGAFYDLSPAQWGYAMKKRGWVWDSLEKFAKEDGIPFDAEYRKRFFSRAAA
jgi:hypothetical protein